MDFYFLLSTSVFSASNFLAMNVNVSNCPSTHSTSNKLGRVLWGIVWLLLYRPSPKPFHAWRRFLLRLFGAKIGRGAFPHASVKIWAPWNLEMGDHSCLSHNVDCYCVAPVKLGAHVTVSQYSYLCTATHDIEQPDMPLITAPIVIGEGAWVTADVFVGPGVTIGEGAVVGARSSVFKDVAPWTVVAGNPARFVRKRLLSEKTDRQTESKK
jgi:putative colanic acid biosynthesis acetyltransferase WcaF